MRGKDREEKGEKSVSVNAGQRNVPETPANIQLDACWLARGVALHAIKICTNKNIFLTEYQTALTDDLIRTAKNIYIYVWTANNINVACFHSWRNNAEKGNSNKLVSRAEKYIKTLRKGGESHEIQEAHTDAGRPCGQ